MACGDGVTLGDVCGIATLGVEAGLVTRLAGVAGRSRTGCLVAQSKSDDAKQERQAMQREINRLERILLDLAEYEQREHALDSTP